MTHVTSAIIVGGGIGGAATALSLARPGNKSHAVGKSARNWRDWRGYSAWAERFFGAG